MDVTVRMAELSWPEYARRIADSVVILPVGSTEQHGPHLPLGTDAMTVTAVAERVAQRVNGLVAPSVSYGYRSAPRSGGGELFTGTTSLSGATLTAVVRDVLSALIRHGATRLVVLDGHYENNMFLHEAIHLVFEAHPASTARIMKLLWVDVIQDGTLQQAWPQGFPGWALEHAAHLETSLMLSLEPALVRRDLIVPGDVFTPTDYDMYPQEPGMVPDSGVLSDPTQATAAYGDLLIEHAVLGLADAITHEFGLPPFM